MIMSMKSVVKARGNQLEGYFADLTLGAFHVVSIDNILTLCRDMPRFRMTGMQHHYNVLSQTDVNQNGGELTSSR